MVRPFFLLGVLFVLAGVGRVVVFLRDKTDTIPELFLPWTGVRSR